MEKRRDVCGRRIMNKLEFKVYFIFFENSSVYVNSEIKEEYASGVTGMFGYIIKVSNLMHISCSLKYFIERTKL